MAPFFIIISFLCNITISQYTNILIYQNCVLLYYVMVYVFMYMSKGQSQTGHPWAVTFCMYIDLTSHPLHILLKRELNGTFTAPCLPRAPT